jgi:hypothetical protein
MLHISVRVSFCPKNKKFHDESSKNVAAIALLTTLRNFAKKLYFLAKPGRVEILHGKA